MRNGLRHLRLIASLAFIVAALPALRADAAGFAAGGDLGIMRARTVQPQGSAFTYLPVLGAHAGGELSVLAAGVKIDLAHDLIFGRSEMFLGAYVGLQLRQEMMMYQVLFEAGRHTFIDIDDDFWGDTTAQKAEMPYVGARIRTGIVWPVRAGLTLFGAWDLEKKPVTVTVTDCSLLACTRGQQSYFEAGGLTVGLAIHVATPQPRRPRAAAPTP